MPIMGQDICKLTLTLFHKNEEYMTIHRILSLLSVSVIICCNANNEVLTKLRDIEGYIQENPKRAYSELSGMDVKADTDKEDYALYSLLMSMAMDKNYIDVTSDSLINNAVEYYSTHGDKLHRFYSYYYLGRICSNAGSYKESLEAYLKAESYVDKTIPIDYRARLHYNKSAVYRHHFANDKALMESTKAKDLAKQLDNPDFFMAYALNESNLYFINELYTESNNTINEIRKWMKDKHIEPNHNYYRACLQQSLVSDISIDSLKMVYSKYIESCNSNHIKPNTYQVADFHLKTGDIEGAEDIIKTIPVPDKDDYFEIIKYYSTLSALCEATGRWDEYRIAQQEYQRAVESLSLNALNDDIRFLEERSANIEEQARSRKDKLVLLAVLLAVLAAGSGAAAALFHKNRKNKLQLEEIRKEYDLITKVFKQTGSDTPESIRNVLDKRINALRPFITNVKFPAPKGRKVLESMNKDRREMLSSIGMLYAMTNPGFTTVLSGKGLSPEEIGLCSLYACGYSSKEMTDILYKVDIYHLNGSIRSKIGEDLGTLNLNTWLKDLYSRTR